MMLVESLFSSDGPVPLVWTFANAQVDGSWRQPETNRGRKPRHTTGTLSPPLPLSLAVFPDLLVRSLNSQLVGEEAAHTVTNNTVPAFGSV